MKKLFLRTITLILIATLLLCTLTACGEDYELRKSSKKEATPVLTLGEDTVNFEVLYTFFRNQCDKIPSFSSTYFDGAEGLARFNATLGAAIGEISEIYAMFALCREAGIDPFGEEVEQKILDYLKLTVEGGTMGESELQGFDGYDEYLDYIEEKFHMNDAVNRLMIRFAICEDMLLAHYRNEYPYTDADVAAYFGGEDCIRLIWVSRTQDAGMLSREENISMMRRAREKLIAGNHSGAIQYSLEPSTDFYMGRYTLDDSYYSELIEVAYDLGEGEVSDVLDLGVEGLFVIKRLPKETAHLSERHESITEIFLYDLQMSSLLDKASELMQGIVYKDFYNDLTAVDFLN